MSDTAGPSRPVGPVHRAFGLVQLVVAAGEPVGVRDLARRSGLSRSTTGRMLGILDELGMVERTPGGAAVPGAALAALTAAAGRSPVGQRERSRPLALDLMREFGENAAVAVDDGDRLLYLTSARIDAAVQVADPAGERFEFHLVAPGLVAMADWSERRIEMYLGAPLRRATPHSVVEPRAVRRRIRQVAADGFAWTDQELDVDVNGLAVPVRSADGRLVAVATLYGPAYRLSAATSPSLGADVAAFVTERAPAYLGDRTVDSTSGRTAGGADERLASDRSDG